MCIRFPVSFTTTNCESYQDEGFANKLPWKYECSNDGNSVLDLEQFLVIVSS